ncbi:MAG: DUF4055 domain-containing protein [Symploca sp. SIO1B1]|nr:DUF4055 domain-containing protein [Symploca sp. SIO1B1]
MTVTVKRQDLNGGTANPQVLKPEYYDPDLPCYHHPSLISLLPILNEVEDCYTGITAWFKGGRIIDGYKASCYLPQAEKEPDTAYINRLKRSRWVNFFRRTIDGFSGLLTDFELSSDNPKSTQDNLEDVDMQGASLRAFLSTADEIALRDGFCGILVEYPKRPEITSAADELAYPLRPYFCLIERRDIVNWSVVNNRLESLVVRRCTTEPEGRYSTKEVEQFWVMTPGYYQVFEIREVDQENRVVILVDEVELRSPNGEVFSEIPIVFYPINTINPFASLPPLHDLALDNIAHYQEWSDYREVRYKCNLPVPVREGMISDPPAPLTIGPNTVVDLPMGGKFYFAEPTGVAIASTRQAIIDLEAEMLRRSLSFFGNNLNMTATEVELRSAQTKSGLFQMAADKESAVQSLFRLWTNWTGEENIGGISVNRSILKAPLSPQAVQVFANLVVGGLLDHQTFWEILNEGGVLPESATVQDLVKRSVPEGEDGDAGTRGHGDAEK